ncbi:hypothetical protein HN51_031066 [Arachis hypogaea]|uniref:Uncharacterized protein LOC107469241 n=1 Tax=Arachis duranensis TaxID=130453 RepID=A0A9C6WRF5_ARADU|nr:uncharacterized protein LOC112715244 [Arachis hypogaea]XP_052111633.1 uncharacterized protein LOC107469241 [Arachis duranensis]XP_057740196.1 uncharacterized protein LOC130957349 [Arachis stenosperma]QHO15649.1 uncharacterized protein DS421_10g296750 [Arachis hypogaea]
MKPESKRNRDDKSSCFDNFGEMSKALLNSDVTVKNESSSNILGSATLQDPKAIQSLSKDCYDFSSLLKTLNCIEKKNVKRLIRIGGIQKIKRKEKKKKISIKFMFVKPNKPFEKNVRVINRIKKEQISDNEFGLEEFLDTARDGSFRFRTRLYIKSNKHPH